MQRLAPLLTAAALLSPAMAMAVGLLRGIALPTPAQPPAPSVPAAVPRAGSPGPAMPSRGNEVLLFEHATHDVNFPGWVFRAYPGLCNAEAGFIDDDASAVYVPAGVKARLYAPLFPDERPLELGPGMHDLADHGFNDILSSIEVLEVAPAQAILRGSVQPPGAAAHEDREWTLPLDPATVSVFPGALHFPDAILQSIEVPAGFVATLVRSREGRGPAHVLGPGRHALPIGFFGKEVGVLRLCPATGR